MIDSVLLVGFGGPERPEDILPFLRNVVFARGIPDARLAEVERHYRDVGGRSPYNELTLAQAHLLRLLQFAPARTMTSIAEALACDASNVTGIVDRLESRGLIRRGNATHDRRIKTITLTTKGHDLVSTLTAGFLEPPDELKKLSEPHLRKLHELLLRAFVRWPVHLS